MVIYQLKEIFVKIIFLIVLQMKMSCVQVIKMDIVKTINVIAKKNLQEKTVIKYQIIQLYLNYA